MTKIDQVEYYPDGHIGIRFIKTNFDPDNPERTEYHRTSIDPGGNLDRQMSAVNAHLEKMGCAPVSDWSVISEKIGEAKQIQDGKTCVVSSITTGRTTLKSAPRVQVRL